MALVTDDTRRAAARPLVSSATCTVNVSFSILSRARAFLLGVLFVGVQLIAEIAGALLPDLREALVTAMTNLCSDFMLGVRKVTHPYSPHPSTPLAHTAVTLGTLAD